MADEIDTFDDRIEEACAWAARLAAKDPDWAAFTAWLEADPANAAAYDLVSDMEAEVDALAPELRRLARSSVGRPRALTRASMTAALVSAGIAAAVGIWAVTNDIPGSRQAASMDYATEASPSHPLRLRPGAIARLDVNSRMSVAEERGRAVELKAGAAYFEVEHDPAQPLVVRAGRVEVRDVGTRFDVAVAPGGEVSVAVAEGEVEVRPPGQTRGITVASGERLIVPPRGPAMRMAVGADDVASWRSGSLRYQGAPLAVVVGDISRYAGRTVVADPRVADLRFSGVLKIGDGTRLVENLEEFLPVTAQTSGGVTRLGPRDGR